MNFNQIKYAIANDEEPSKILNELTIFLFYFTKLPNECIIIDVIENPLFEIAKLIARKNTIIQINWLCTK